MKTTLKDIAEATGYSIPTVSRVLNNGDKFYSDETAKIILDVAQKMNYKPNIMARGLKTGKSYSIAMLVPQLDDFYDSVFRSTQQRLSENGYSLVVFSSDYDEKIEKAKVVTASKLITKAKEAGATGIMNVRLQVDRTTVYMYGMAYKK